MAAKKKSALGDGSARFMNNSKHTSQVLSSLTMESGRGKSVATGFYRLPCDKLEEFTLKQEYDFSPWKEEKFQELLLSVKEFGVLQPIVVRELPQKTGHYEVLAGEHRWKASKKLGIETVPAHILTNCDDDRAKSVFTLTNIVSRDLTIGDKIQGWSHYYDLTKGKTQETIKILKEQGILETIEEKDISKRQIFRFYKINQLEEPLRQLVLTEKISVNSGEQLANFSKTQQILLSSYGEQLQSPAWLRQVVALEKGERPGQILDEKGLHYLFQELPNLPQKPSFSGVMKGAKRVLKAKLTQDQYENSEEILEEALDLYQKKDLIQRALDAYAQAHPEDFTEIQE